MARQAIESLYDLVTGDEDARVCKDIPEEACRDQPRNFFAYLLANLLGKIADELASARLTLPWLLGALGTPTAFIGFLVPIREAGVLVPQLIVAAFIRRMPIRKTVWMVGSLLTAGALVLMALSAKSLSGATAGWALIGRVTVYSLARGLCSVSAKDVLGKTVSKSRRGTLMGYSAGVAGLATLALGVYLEYFRGEVGTASLFFALLLAGAGLWVVATGVFALIIEQPGATEGGGNALQVAVQSLLVLRSDREFRDFVWVRILLLSAALAPPFYVLLAQQRADEGAAGLGLLIIASGVAGSVSAPIWGRQSDRSSRAVMARAAGLNGILGLIVFGLVQWDPAFLQFGLTWAVLFMLVAICHSGARLGRKVYLVDLASGENRATYVAVSNTVIGLAMLAGGVVGAAGDWLGSAAVIALLGLVSLVAAWRARHLPEVSEPST